MIEYLNKTWYGRLLLVIVLPVRVALLLCGLVAMYIMATIMFIPYYIITGKNTMRWIEPL